MGQISLPFLFFSSHSLRPIPFSFPELSPLFPSLSPEPHPSPVLALLLPPCAADVWALPIELVFDLETEPKPLSSNDRCRLHFVSQQPNRTRFSACFAPLYKLRYPLAFRYKPNTQTLDPCTAITIDAAAPSFATRWSRHLPATPVRSPNTTGL